MAVGRVPLEAQERQRQAAVRSRDLAEPALDVVDAEPVEALAEGAVELGAVQVEQAALGRELADVRDRRRPRRVQPPIARRAASMCAQ